LPFRHAFVRLGRHITQPDMLRTLYSAMMATVGLIPVERRDGVYQSGPYNLLLTGEWMLMVPRSREFFAAVSINGLGYAGSLFVKDQRQVEIIEEHGPMSVLTEVGFRI
jgi:ATP adenylyltransferase